jgi:hypothetical protein
MRAVSIQVDRESVTLLIDGLLSAREYNHDF